MRRRPPVPATVEAHVSLPAWAAICFLASGAAGLLYEVVWSKQLSYLLGNSLHAVATVVAAFLTGLALGAYLLGARLARLRRGARVYAGLEVGIGLLGLASMPALRGLDPVVGVLYHAFGGETGFMALARFLLLFALLLPPTVLMGATLPVLVAHFEYRSVGPALARLYGVNTGGAVLGSALGGFVLLPGVGLTATTWIAAALNVTAAALAWIAAGRAPASSVEQGLPAAAPPRAPSATAAPLLAAGEGHAPMLKPAARARVAGLFALSGLAALAFQIAWVRLFGLLFGSSVYSFSAVLSVYLAGLAVGSAAIAPWLRGLDRPGGAARLLGVLAALQLALAAVTLVSIRLFPWLPEAFFVLGWRAAGNWALFYLGELGLVALVLALPCVAFGAIFPVAARLLQTRDGGHATGLAYAVNTAGTLAGSLLAGFALIPMLGVQGTHLSAAVASGVAGVAALWMAMQHGLPRGRALAWLVGVVAAGALLTHTAPRWDPALMSAGVFRPAAAQRLAAAVGAGRDPVRRYTRGERVLFYREGVNGSVYVASDSAGTNRWLKVGGKTDASTNDMVTQVLLGVLPGVIVPKGSRAAVIGLGSGVSVAAMLATGPGSIEVMEIEPAVVEASRFFDEPGHGPLDDPRVTLVVEDARTRLFNVPTTWDLISAEPSNPWIAGTNNLFTVDYYRRLRQRLAPTGVFCQWVQLYELAPETLGSLLRSFLEVFPTGYAFMCVDQDLLLVATPPGDSLSLGRLREAAVTHQLERARQLGPESVAAWFACSFDSLWTLTRGAPLNTDDRPVVEYRAPLDLYRVGRQKLGGQAASLLPVTGWDAARPLFSGWPREVWLLGRVRQLTRHNDYDAALAAARDAGRVGLPELERELVTLVEAGRRGREAGLLILRARDAALAGRMGDARDALIEATTLVPTHGSAWALLAEAQRSLGDQGAAVAAVEQAVAFGDSAARADARVVQGLVEMSRGAPREAARAFGEAVRWSPRNEQMWLFQAQALRSAGDLAGAADVCRRGIDIAAPADRLRALLESLLARP